jgi:hypothetical protein
VFFRLSIERRPHVAHEFTCNRLLDVRSRAAVPEEDEVPFSSIRWVDPHIPTVPAVAFVDDDSPGPEPIADGGNDPRDHVVPSRHLVAQDLELLSSVHGGLRIPRRAQWRERRLSLSALNQAV